MQGDIFIPLSLVIKLIGGTIGWCTILAGWLIRTQYDNGNRLTAIEAHLGELNGKVEKNSQWIQHRQEYPPWMDSINHLSQGLLELRSMNQLLINDLNERRAERHLPPLLLQ